LLAAICEAGAAMEGPEGKQQGLQGRRQALGLRHLGEAARSGGGESRPQCARSVLIPPLASAPRRQVNVLDKTKMDWQDYKAADTAVEEELEAHKRSGAQYLDRQEFLKRTELREYELERDKRLAADVRTRGRL
jgi:hypothetical protein